MKTRATASRRIPITGNCQRFYDLHAPGFDAEQERFAFVRGPEKEIVLRALEAVLRPEQDVLEIGAGTGRFTMLVAPRVRHVTAVDLSANMLRQMAEKMVSQKIGNIERLHGDFVQLDLARRFDLVISFSAIEYVKDQEALFSKMAALLKPGGQLLLTTPHRTFIRWWGRLGNFFRQRIFMTAYSKDEMARLLERHGLHVVAMQALCLRTFFNPGLLLFIHAAK
jgi:ubiquinone/menaquinone biosynthesis C-methylase UbiE